MNCKANILGRG